MTRIPQRLEISEIQQSFREIWTATQPLLTGNMDLKGRRVTGATDSVSPQDYITRYEADEKYSFDAVRAAMAQAGFQWNPDKIIYPVIPKQTFDRVDIVDNRGDPYLHQNELFSASDRGFVTWISTYITTWGGTPLSPPAWKWVYLFGYHKGAQLVGTPLPSFGPAGSALTAYDEGFLYWGTTTAHLHRWTGTAWWWGPADAGSGMIVASTGEVGTTLGGAWELCDGSAYNMTNPDGTLTSYTTPNMCADTDGELFLTADDINIGVTQAAVVAKWDTTSADTHRTDANTTGVTVATHAPPATLDKNGSGADIQTFKDAGERAHSITDAGHYHALTDTYAKLKAPSTANGGVPKRMALKWYVRL